MRQDELPNNEWVEMYYLNDDVSGSSAVFSLKEALGRYPKGEKVAILYRDMTKKPETLEIGTLYKVKRSGNTFEVKE